MTERIREALQFICSDDRDTWLKCGMAVKSALGDSGFDLWDEWSMQSDSYKPESAKAVWRSIREFGGVTEGTLFYLAISNGWRDDGNEHKPTAEEIAERKRLALKRFTEDEKQVEIARAAAARKAQAILGLCELDRHAYAHSKGFPDLLVNVWRREGHDPIMVIPIYYNNSICGIQLISTNGNKKFLKGQRMECAYLKIGSGDKIFLVEGWATGMSAQAILAKLGIRYTVIICFSAGNMAKMAKIYKDSFIFADNDTSKTGQKVAEESGCRWWMPPAEGDDLNDWHMMLGTFKASLEIKRVLMCHPMTE